MLPQVRDFPPITSAPTGPARRQSWIPILGYHRVVGELPAGDVEQISVTTSRLETQMRWFARLGYETHSLNSVAHDLLLGRPIPRRRFVITFDDGYRDTLENAVPVLERFGFTATVFVVTGQVGRTNSWDEGVSVQVPLMDWNQLGELVDRGFSIGSHTVTHRALTRLSEGEISYELTESRRMLEERLGVDVRTFCYPWGEWAPHIRDAVAEAGYWAACDDVGGTTNEQFVLARADPTYWLALLTPLVRSSKLYFDLQRRSTLRAVARARRRWL
jgi:peptidoglycan/xylan/chitin deacetylase (PgdA/CDA1 family)